MDVALVRHCILHSALYKQLSLAKIEAWRRVLAVVPKIN